jgi:hypothetical protein
MKRYYHYCTECNSVWYEYYDKYDNLRSEFYAWLDECEPYILKLAKRDPKNCGCKNET